LNERRRIGEAAVNLIVIGEALIKIGKAMKKKLSGKRKRGKRKDLANADSKL